MNLDLEIVSSYLSSLGLPSEIPHPELLETALTHKSYAADLIHNHPHNERLEFLGDGVVGLTINDLLYHDYPNEEESTLTLHKISLVRQDTLALAARHIGLDQHIILGKGEKRKGGNNNDAILCDCFEAFVGRIYLDHGRDLAYQFIKTHVYGLKDSVHIGPIKSYKSLIQEYVQAHHKTLPIYNEREYSRNDRSNEVIYESTIMINGENVGIGLGPSKRKAQEEAAKIAYEKLGHQK